VPISRGVRERAANSGLLYLASGLETPVSPFWRAKSPKVSGRFRKYSRFQETAAGDLVRTPLLGEGGSHARNVRSIPESGHRLRGGLAGASLYDASLLLIAARLERIMALLNGQS